MAPLTSLSILFLFLILFASSTAAQSQKTTGQLLTRRNLASIDEESQGQQPTIPKPSTKRKKLALVDRQQQEEEEEEEENPKPITKKKKLTSEREQDEEEPISKPTTKKKKLAPTEREEESSPTLKPATKKKKIAPTGQEEEQPIAKPTSKKKKLAPIEPEEEQADPKPVTKKKAKKIVDPIDEEEDQPSSKPATKKKKSNPIEQEEDQPIPKSTTKVNKNPTFDSKNQTKPIKIKKSNSTSTQIPTLTTSKSKPNKTVTPKPSNSTAKPEPKPEPVNPIWLEEPEPDSDSDLISEFRDLPNRIHQSLLPDLKKISITSKAYIYKANKNIADNVKPFVGNKFAPKIALAFSCIFLILPLCLVTFLFYHLNSYLSLQRFLMLVQAYLAIYFFTLSVTAVVTGLEPLKFFYATSPDSYAWTQAVQTLGYLLYLLVQLIHLVVVFSAGDNKVGVRMLGLIQMIVGLAVGGHYYAAVFHRAVTGDPPRANWKVHGVYAGCFLVICLCARAQRGKKAYDGGEDGKKS